MQKKNELNSFKSNILKNNIHLYVHLYQGNIDKKNKKTFTFFAFILNCSYLLLSLLPSLFHFFLTYIHTYFPFYPFWLVSCAQEKLMSVEVVEVVGIVLML